MSDGRHQEGLVFYTDRVSTWTDRFVVMDTASEFHTYRLVIRGTDMSMAVDGDVKVQGQNAFWKPRRQSEPFIQFGSNSEEATGRSRVAFACASACAKPPHLRRAAPVKITLSEPWPITRPDLKTKPTRPYVYDIGGGRLLMSVAEGPDAIYEPYGVMLSTDAGKTWSPVKDWDFTDMAPLPMLRLKDGSVLGMSRWTWPQPDGTLRRPYGALGRGPRKSPPRFESRIPLPPEYTPTKVPFTVRAPGLRGMRRLPAAWPAIPRPARARPKDCAWAAATRICCAPPMAAKRGITLRSSAPVASPPSCRPARDE